jgi:hypothetical protein
VFYTWKTRSFVVADDRRKDFGFSDNYAFEKMFEQGKQLFN